MKRTALVVIALLSLLGFVSAKRRAVRAPSPPQTLTLAADRSFVITEKAVLEPFRFERVLDAITKGSSITSETFFRQWWSLQAEPQCQELLNGFARRCPTDEAKLATEPFRPDDFIPIGITNRFDQANDTQCGQYRLIYANRLVTADEAFHIIFEAEMPNPKPELGLAGCRPVAQFWADLSKVEAPEGRRERLEQFFFDGIAGFPPAVHADHFHRNQSGIRTLQFTLPFNFASFYQFRVVSENGNPVMKADVLENLLSQTFIDANNQDEKAKRFRQVFVENVKTLAIPDANLYHMKIPAEFLVPDPSPKQGEFQFALGATFFRSRSTEAGKAFEAEIAAELQRIGSTLTPHQVVVRAETQDCIGCHFLGTPVGEGVEFPAALEGSQHVSEDGATATHFVMSPAMKDVFVPHRMKILKDFLLHGKAPVHSN